MVIYRHDKGQILGDSLQVLLVPISVDVDSKWAVKTKTIHKSISVNFGETHAICSDNIHVILIIMSHPVVLEI